MSNWIGVEGTSASLCGSDCESTCTYLRNLSKTSLFAIVSSNRDSLAC